MNLSNFIFLSLVSNSSADFMPLVFLYPLQTSENLFFMFAGGPEKDQRQEMGYVLS